MTNTSLPTFSFNTTIRPGLLVAVKTSIKGNVSYKKTDTAVRTLEDGSEVAEWDTERRIKDAAEQEAASKARSRARSLISGVCSVTDFGYLCPVASRPELDVAIAEARKVAEEFNRTSKFTKLRFEAVTGTIAQNDYQAVRAIRREVAELLTDMEEGLKNLDVGVAREAATRAKQLGQMLSAEAEVRVELAIQQVRESCKKIAAAGENGVAEIDRVTIARLTETRTAFLDMDEAQEVEAPTQQARTVDLETVAA
jgi:ribosomal protein L29